MSLHDLLKSIDLPKVISVLQLVHVATSTDLLKTVTSLESTDVIKLAHLLKTVDFTALQKTAQIEGPRNEAGRGNVQTKAPREKDTMEESLYPDYPDSPTRVYARCHTF